MLQEKRRVGRPPKASHLKAARIGISLPTWMDERVRQIAESEDAAVSHVIQRFVNRGLVEHEAEKSLERKAA